MLDAQFVMSVDAVKRPLGDHTAVYHRQRGGLCLLDDSSIQLFDSFRYPRAVPSSWIDEDPSDRDAELFQQLVARGLLCDTKYSSSELPADPGTKVNVIQLILANACNFGCTYCFEGIQGKELSVEQEVAKIDLSRLKSREEIKVDLNNSMYASRERLQHQYDPKNRHMKPEDAVRYVKDALEVSIASGAAGAMVQFFGGEPFLNWKAIDAVLDEFGRGEKHGIRIDYSTVTNGSLLTEEIAAKLAKYEVGVCVSFDSPTSPSRPLKNGDDSTPVVMQGLRLLQKYRNRVAINAALTSATWDEFNNSIVDLAVEVEAGEIGVVVDFDPTFYARYGTTNIVEKLWQVVEYGRQRGVVLTGYWHQIFQVLLGHDVVTERGFKNCSAKGAQFSIEPNGSVFSCKAGSTLLGSIEQGKDLLKHPPYQAHHALRNDNPAFCKGCEIEGFCAGLCLGPLEKKFAAIDAIEPSACDFYRGITLKHIQALQPYEVATFDLQPPLAQSLESNMTNSAIPQGEGAIHFRAHGYAVISTPTLDTATLNSFNRMPRDGHSVKRLREIRLSQFFCYKDEGQWIFALLPRRKYIQSAAYIRLAEAGGVLRHREQLECVPSPLIALVLDTLPIPAEGQYQINVNQIRVIANTDFKGVTVPEGPHRDGHKFSVIAIAGRHNVRGGETQVIEPSTGQVIFRQTLDVNQAILIDDERYIHYATDIEPEQGDAGHRDIWVIEINRWDQRAYGPSHERQASEVRLTEEIAA